MCGIAGFFDARPATRAAREAILLAMAEALRHRGPDDGGSWIDAEAGIALSQRRLAIIDLSPTGHQPMASADGRYIITFNGEIYNYRELAERLRQEGVALRGRSDTEVFLEGLARWGLGETLVASEGMFAFALWDREMRSLTLARDRLGIKPLYWGKSGGLFFFGSELKALRRHPGWQPELDRDALSAFMRFGYVPAPFSIYRQVRKLEPGTCLVLRGHDEPRIERYWDLCQHAAAGSANPAAGSESELLDTLERVLRRAVGNEMVADVPLGAFLSGGIDSSLVTALMQAESSQPIRTFTIGFEQDGFNEAQHAARVARHLGTDHTELYVADATARDTIPHLPVWYDEPFADSSQIPTQLVSRLARQHVTVALSGDGGDEIFAGYTRYRWGERLWRAMAPIPAPLRHGAAAALAALPDGAVRAAAGLMPSRLRPWLPEQKVKKLAGLLGAADAGALYRCLVSQWPEPDQIVIDGAEPRGLSWDSTLPGAFPGLTERMQVMDTLTYLPDDILTKVDRASMSVGLEARVPLLNHRVVEFAWRLPPSMRLRGATTKWALRQLLHRFVPPELVERPKQGFGVPLAAWLRGPLREWADDLLEEGLLRRGGWLRPEPIAARWREHRAGTRDWGYGLWCVLMFQAWLGQNGAAAVEPATFHSLSAAVLHGKASRD